MIKPTELAHEPLRVETLKSYSILDTIEEADYDNLTLLASQICDTPISLISLVDDKRQWFKSHHGLKATETPKEFAFCAHAINDPNNVFIVQDARMDERFHDNPLVTGDPHVIFYAGVPLISDEGMPLGTLCVIDNKPNLLSQSQIVSLKALTNQVINLLRLRKKNILLNTSLERLKEKNQELERFAFVAAHDLKSPLINIANMASMFLEDYGESIPQDGKETIELIEQSSDKLRRLIDGLLEYSRSDKMLSELQSTIHLEALTHEVSGLFSYENELLLTLNTNLENITTNRTVLERILINLVANSVKYSDKNLTEINIQVTELDKHYEFIYTDNGPGIDADYQKKAFTIFEVLTPKDKFGKVGNGIGLAIVKKLVKKSGGNISLTSELGKGVTFKFTIKKQLTTSPVM